MANDIHVMPAVFDDRIVAGRMRRDSSGRLIAIRETTDVTEEAVNAVVYHYYCQAKEEANGKVAYEYTLANGQRVIVQVAIKKEADE